MSLLTPYMGSLYVRALEQMLECPCFICARLVELKQKSAARISNRCIFIYCHAYLYRYHTRMRNEVRAGWTWPLLILIVTINTYFYIIWAWYLFYLHSYNTQFEPQTHHSDQKTQNSANYRTQLFISILHITDGIRANYELLLILIVLVVGDV